MTLENVKEVALQLLGTPRGLWLTQGWPKSSCALWRLCPICSFCLQLSSPGSVVAKSLPEIRSHLLGGPTPNFIGLACITGLTGLLGLLLPLRFWDFFVFSFFPIALPLTSREVQNLYLLIDANIQISICCSGYSINTCQMN